jgi:hypothetical protein
MRQTFICVCVFLLSVIQFTLAVDTPYGLRLITDQPSLWDTRVLIDKGSAHDKTRPTVIKENNRHTILLTFAKHVEINMSHFLEFSITDLPHVSHVFLRTLNSQLEKIHICEELETLRANNDLGSRSIPTECPIAANRPIQYQITLNNEFWSNVHKHRRELIDKPMTLNVRLWNGKPCVSCSSRPLLSAEIPIFLSS